MRAVLLGIRLSFARERRWWSWALSLSLSESWAERPPLNCGYLLLVVGWLIVIACGCKHWSNCSCVDVGWMYVADRVGNLSSRKTQEWCICYSCMCISSHSHTHYIHAHHIGMQLCGWLHACMWAFIYQCTCAKSQLPKTFVIKLTSTYVRNTCTSHLHALTFA